MEDNTKWALDELQKLGVCREKAEELLRLSKVVIEETLDGIMDIPITAWDKYRRIEDAYRETPIGFVIKSVTKESMTIMNVEDRATEILENANDVLKATLYWLLVKGEGMTLEKAHEIRRRAGLTQ